MKAIAVVPGRPDSVHLAQLPKPAITDVPGGRGVLVKVLRVGVDGTDREINAAEYGAAPDGYDFLVIGHESFGVVEEAGPGVSFLRPGDFVVATVRRPGHSIYDAIGLQDMTTDTEYFERLNRPTLAPMSAISSRSFPRPAPRPVSSSPITFG
jgi:threonine dehydrogenase-like Zn-dependent dehydrogenase